MKTERRELSEKIDLALARAQYTTGMAVCFISAFWGLLSPGA